MFVCLASQCGGISSPGHFGFVFPLQEQENFPPALDVTGLSLLRFQINCTANYTDRATAACQRSYCQLLRMRVRSRINATELVNCAVSPVWGTEEISSTATAVGITGFLDFVNRPELKTNLKKNDVSETGPVSVFRRRETPILLTPLERAIYVM
jgi:hypothetical protein